MKAGDDVDGVLQWSEEQTVREPPQASPPYVIQPNCEAQGPGRYAANRDVDFILETTTEPRGLAFEPILSFNRFHSRGGQE
jgi:hypothetical protein